MKRGFVVLRLLVNIWVAFVLLAQPVFAHGMILQTSGNPSDTGISQSVEKHSATFFKAMRVMFCHEDSLHESTDVAKIKQMTCAHCCLFMGAFLLPGHGDDLRFFIKEKPFFFHIRHIKSFGFLPEPEPPRFL